MSKVTLRELREEARRIWPNASVWDGLHGTVPKTVVATGDGYHVDISGHTRMGARRNALACLRAMQPVGGWGDE